MLPRSGLGVAVSHLLSSRRRHFGPSFTAPFSQLPPLLRPASLAAPSPAPSFLGLQALPWYCSTLQRPPLHLPLPEI